MTFAEGKCVKHYLVPFCPFCECKPLFPISPADRDISPSAPQLPQGEEQMQLLCKSLLNKYTNVKKTNMIFKINKYKCKDKTNNSSEPYQNIWSICTLIGHDQSIMLKGNVKKTNIILKGIEYLLIKRTIHNNPLISDDREDDTVPSYPVVVITSVNWSVNDFFSSTRHTPTLIGLLYTSQQNNLTSRVPYFILDTKIQGCHTLFWTIRMVPYMELSAKLKRSGETKALQWYAWKTESKLYIHGWRNPDDVFSCPKTFSKDIKTIFSSTLHALFTCDIRLRVFYLWETARMHVCLMFSIASEAFLHCVWLFSTVSFHSGSGG